MIELTGKISIVVPAYNEEEGITYFYAALEKVLNEIGNYKFKTIFVNDGSSDGTLAKLRSLASTNESISYISLSKNCGKEIALLAGLDYVKKSQDAVIIMDSDLQHPPKLIPKLIAEWEKGAKDVYAVKTNRDYDPLLKRVFTKVYYQLLKWGLNKEIEPGAGDFRLLDRQVLDALVSFRESQRYTKGLYDLVGFKKASVNFIVPERQYGETKWGLAGLFRLAIDGITSYSTFPLRLAIFFGVLFSLFSFFYMAYIIIKTILHGDPVAGYPSLISIVLFLGGVQLLCTGILGEYLGKIFYESKQRPLYFVEEHKD